MHEQIGKQLNILTIKIKTRHASEPMDRRAARDDTVQTVRRLHRTRRSMPKDEINKPWARNERKFKRKIAGIEHRRILPVPMHKKPERRRSAIRWYSGTFPLPLETSSESDGVIGKMSTAKMRTIVTAHRWREHEAVIIRKAVRELKQLENK